MAQINKEEIGILHLFERSSDSLVYSRANNSVFYNLPQELMPEGISVTTRRDQPEATSIDIDYMPSVRDLPQSITSIPRDSVFSHFNSAHMRAALDLCGILSEEQDIKGLLNCAANIRDRVNETLFIYCLSWELKRKPEYRGIGVPCTVEIMPSKFISKDALDKAVRSAAMSDMADEQPETITVEHDMDFTGTDSNLEHRVAYWREDYGINSHHWHWHLVFPLRTSNNRDRKGEMFYYMHQQMLARYEMERLSNNLLRVEPLDNWREPIASGYFPKLRIGNSGRHFGNRQDGAVIFNYNRRDNDREPFSVHDLEQWRRRILDGINNGFFINKSGNNVPLSDDVDILNGDKRGIDIIADALEADSNVSVNHPFYGDLHNFGHVIIASCHDPNGFHKEEIGVMGAAETAMRDPVFYRWHKFIDNVFQTYKLTQPPYNLDQLVVEGIKLDKCGVQSCDDSSELKTFFDTKQIVASRGLDFGTSLPVIVNLTRLNHQPFNYNLQITNEKCAPFVVTVRIFLAPKYNESGSEMDFMEQRSLWVEMDKFKYKLNPGANHIVRASTESSITTAEELTFRDLEGLTAPRPTVSEAYCGCGWPQHMLLPRGKEQGMPFQLFALLSDYSLDKVSEQTTSKASCGKAVSYCGLLDEMYPDRRPMGYPFDRRQMRNVTTMEQFVRQMPNSIMEDITIRFNPAKKVIGKKQPLKQ